MVLMIKNHIAGVIVRPSNLDEFLLSVYDEGYPREMYRGARNMIGGNFENGDSSPYSILRREIKEEFDGSGLSGEDSSLVTSLREEILLNSHGWNDFIFQNFYGKGDDELVMASVYLCEIPQSLFNDIKGKIRAERRLVTEGLLGISKLDDFKSGKHRLAWGMPYIVGELIGDKSLANPQNVKGKIIGQVRENMEAYRGEYLHNGWIFSL